MESNPPLDDQKTKLIVNKNKFVYFRLILISLLLSLPGAFLLFLAHLKNVGEAALFFGGLGMLILIISSVICIPINVSLFPLKTKKQLLIPLVFSILIVSWPLTLSYILVSKEAVARAELTNNLKVSANLTNEKFTSVVIPSSDPLKKGTIIKYQYEFDLVLNNESNQTYSNLQIFPNLYSGNKLQFIGNIITINNLQKGLQTVHVIYIPVHQMPEFTKEYLSNYISNSDESMRLELEIHISDLGIQKKIQVMSNIKSWHKNIVQIDQQIHQFD